MSDPLEVAREILDTERQMEALASERPKILGDLFQAESDQDLKTVAKIRGGLLDLDMKLDSTRQHKMNLQLALDRAIGDEMDRQAASVPELEKQLRQEVQDVGREIGELLGRAEFLEGRYGGKGYTTWASSLDAYGKRPSPPESCAALYQAIGQAKSAAMASLPGSDPVAESFFARRNELRDSREQRLDANVKAHRVAKRRALVMSLARNGG